VGETLLRGRVLTFVSEPESLNDESAYKFHEDGAVLVRDGLIASAGDYANVVAAASGEVHHIDHRPHLILPGFIDTHIHFPQTQVIASWGAQLLDWLSIYTFPEEAKYSDPAHCQRMARKFFDALAAHGTTSAVTFCSVHKTSAEAFFEEAARRDLRMIAGKVMMDRNAPESVCDTPQSSYDDTKALIEKWHGKGRAHYAITPRFAITSTPEQLEMAQALAGEHPECYVQTHLSENKDEIEYTLKLYPDARDYLDVYEHYGLLGPRSLFGHSIHLSKRERAAMADTGSVAVFCPTSNLFLGSGLYDEAGLRADGVRTAISTDVGGGTNYSMLRTLDEGYKILQLRGQKLDPFKAFYWVTLGNALALSLEEKIGTLEPETEADIVVLNARATPAMELRMETVQTLAEELFLLQTLGDDRAVVQTYAAGRALK
jgi:guanine deaminase